MGEMRDLASTITQQFEALVEHVAARFLSGGALPPGHSSEAQARAVAAWGKHGLVEIVVLSGFYQMFAAINQGFDIRHGGHFDTALAPSS